MNAMIVPRNTSNDVSKFLPCDEAEFQSIINRPRSASEGNERWAINRFNRWHQCKGLDTGIPFEKFLYKNMECF